MTTPSSTVTAPGATAQAPQLTRKPRTSFYRRYESFILGGGTLLVLAVIWEACWQSGLISPLFFSGPSAIARKFVELTLSGELGRNAVYSGTN